MDNLGKYWRKFKKVLGRRQLVLRKPAPHSGQQNTTSLDDVSLGRFQSVVLNKMGDKKRKGMFLYPVFMRPISLTFPSDARLN